MNTNVVPIKYDSSLSPILAIKKDNWSERDSGCLICPISITYDVQYDYRRDKITVIKMEHFSPQPKQLSQPLQPSPIASITSITPITSNHNYDRKQDNQICPRDQFNQIWAKNLATDKVGNDFSQKIIKTENCSHISVERSTQNLNLNRTNGLKKSVRIDCSKNQIIDDIEGIIEAKLTHNKRDKICENLEVISSDVIIDNINQNSQQTGVIIEQTINLSSMSLIVIILISVSIVFKLYESVLNSII